MVQENFQILGDLMKEGYSAVIQPGSAGRGHWLERQVGPVLSVLGSLRGGGRQSVLQDPTLGMETSMKLGGTRHELPRLRLEEGVGNLGQVRLQKKTDIHVDTGLWKHGSVD